MQMPTYTQASLPSLQEGSAPQMTPICPGIQRGVWIKNELYGI